MVNLPITATVIDEICCTSNNIGPRSRIRGYNSYTWILTYLVYMSFHLSRRPISIVKSTLNQNCTEMFPNHHDNNTHWCDWPPFDKDDSQTLLGDIDSCFLFAYAVGMFICGTIAERMDLRYFLSTGMILSGVFTAMFGLGHAFKIHVLWFYALSMVLNGLVQASGWPSVVAVMGNWFGKSKRGLIMGVWNSHTSVGNILGALIASAFVETDWTWSFVVPGIIVGTIGVLVFLFLIPKPSYIGLPDPNHKKDISLLPRESSYPTPRGASVEELENLLNEEDVNTSSYGVGDSDSTNPPSETQTSSTTSIVVAVDPSVDRSQQEHKAIGFFSALKIPGVFEFSLCLFFSKLVSYTFLYWLPNYLQHKTSYDSKDSANLSTLFDVGGVFGGIMAGIISDTSNKPATTCAVMLIFAIPMMFIYNTYGTVSLGVNILLLMITGVLVNGPYSLITTAVSAELGTHDSLRGNAHALATVTAIIDGTGSIGAAVGPLFAGYVSDLDWNYVFYMLMAADVLALLLLTRLVYHEIQSLLRR